MHTHWIITALGALAQRSRLAIFRLLVQAGEDGLAAGRIAEALHMPASSLSFHLKEMIHAQLLTSRSEGRSVIYAANFQTMHRLLAFLTANCCKGAPCPPLPIAAEIRSDGGFKMNEKIYNVLFICSGNSARSIMAEALLNAMGKGRFHAYSAGSQPTGVVHPLALEKLARENIPVQDARSKSWNEFTGPDAPEMDFVITVCDRAAGETCPSWPGKPITAHWGVPDPAAVSGSENVQYMAFARAFAMLERRISIFINLYLPGLGRSALEEKVREIGQIADL